jgi:hypothetical protein
MDSRFNHEGLKGHEGNPKGNLKKPLSSFESFVPFVVKSCLYAI